MSPPGDPADEDATAAAGEEDDAEADEFEPTGFERWRRDTALGTVGTGIAKGLQNVFAHPADQPVIVISVPGDPPDPDRLRVLLDPDDPTKSIVVFPPAWDREEHDDESSN